MSGFVWNTQGTAVALTLLPHRVGVKRLLLDPIENSDLQQCLDTDPTHRRNIWHGKGHLCNPAGSTQVLEGALLLLSDLQQTPGTRTHFPCQPPPRKLHLFLSGIEGKISRSIIKLRAASIPLFPAPGLAGSCVRVTPSVLPWKELPGNAKNSKRSNQKLLTEQTQGTVPALSSILPLWAARLISAPLIPLKPFLTQELQQNHPSLPCLPFQPLCYSFYQGNMIPKPPF